MTKRFLAGTTLLSLGRSLRDRVLAGWLHGEAPMTVQRLYQQALDLAGDGGTAVLLCHNVTKAFVREGVAITWRGTGRERSTPTARRRSRRAGSTAPGGSRATTRARSAR